MTIQELIEKLSSYSNKEAKLQLIQEEDLECMPELWDDEKHKPSGKATEIYCEDVHSHNWYLLAIEK